MKVNIRGVIYDAETEPILIELNKSDKENIKNMHPYATKYICFPNSMKFEEVECLLNLKPQENKLKLYQDVYFVGENISMKVMAISDNYAICFKEENKKPYFLCLDFKNNIRNIEPYIFDRLDGDNQKYANIQLKDFEEGKSEINRKNCRVLNIDWELTEKLN